MNNLHQEIATATDVLAAARKKMNSAKDHLQYELNTIRTGRANPALLDSVNVEVYGTSMRLRDVATITAPEPQQLLITPFDANNTKAIGKSIEKANLGFNVIVEANLVRISIPPMDENQRKERVKQAKKKTEDGKISIRNIRRECNDVIKKQKSNGDITEDDMKKMEKNVQKLTDNFCHDFDNIMHDKEKDIMEI